MITDRDIVMCALFQAKTLRDLRVSDATMAQEARTCTPGDFLADAENIMREGKIRRLPVVDDEGRLLGIISLADLAQEAARERSAKSKEITEEEVGDTLAAICEPLSPRLAA
jgi:CBS domain-containing protein